jgi:predicted PurR-regulated permease PerM
MIATWAQDQRVGRVIDTLETKSASDAPADDEPEMPLPNDPLTVFVGGLFILAMFAALYVARDVAMPVILAFVLKLLLQPLVRMLEDIYVPRIVGVIMVLCLLLGVLTGVGMAIAGPGSGWANKLPESLPRLQQHLSFIAEPIGAVRSLLKRAEQSVQKETPPAPPAAPAPTPTEPTAPALHESVVLGALFATTADVVTAILTTIIVLFFLLLSGDAFLRRLVEILPRFKEKRQAVDIAQQVERNISAYLLTITLMNVAVGVATGVIMWACGVGDPLLWGTVAFLLNYVPVLGPIIATILFAMVGLLMFDSLWHAMMPATLYFGIHLLEGEFVTPMVLAKRLTLNPVLVVLSLIFWFWMWGVAGAILAVPMLAITKIICDSVRSLAAIGHFLEG